MDSEPGGMTCDDEDVDKMEASIELTEEEQREEGIPVPQVRSVPSPSVRTPPSGNPYKHHSNISHILLPSPPHTSHSSHAHCHKFVGMCVALLMVSGSDWVCPLNYLIRTNCLCHHPESHK